MIARFSIFAVLILPLLPAQAAPIYKWVDENGQVHFSDTPIGPSGAAELTDMQTHFNGSAPLAADSPWTIRNQLDYLEQRRSRLAEERRREKMLALEKKAIELEQQRLSETIPQVVVPPVVTVPAPWSFSYPYYSGNRPLPSYPAARPGFRHYDHPYHANLPARRDTIRRGQRQYMGNPNPKDTPPGRRSHIRGSALDYQHSGDHHRFNLMLRDRY